MLLNLLKLICYAFSICGFIFYVNKIVDNFFFEPDIGTIEKFIAADTIPFPAITICSPMIFNNDFDQTFHDPLLHKDSLRKLSVDEQNLLQVKSLICHTNSTRMMAILELTKNRTRRDFVKLLKEKSLMIDESFYDCYDEEGHKPCSGIMERSLTDIGFCYTYNMQSYDTILNEDVISSDFYFRGGKSDENSRLNWTLEGGYISNDENLFPRRCVLYGREDFGMAINSSFLDKLCQVYKKKIRFIFHLPNEIPTIFHRFQTISINTKLRLSISAIAYATDTRLKKYASEKRYCYFDGERKLKFFKTYTKAHCFLECFSNFTLQKCNCSKFSHPRSEDTSVCDIIDAHCLEKAKYLWLKSEKKLSKTSTPCNCLPPCANIEYQIVQSQMNDFNGKTSMTLEHFKDT
jgi:acid-sensing ion channel, other